MRAVQRRNADKVLAQVGLRVQELRRTRGLTQEQLAEAGEVSVSWVQQIESGRANLRLRTLVAIAEMFDVDVGLLLRRPRASKARPGRPRLRRKQ